MRDFGKTGMKIKRVGFGGIPIQRISQEDTNKVIDELEKCGVNFIDTARGYTVSYTHLYNRENISILLKYFILGIILSFFAIIIEKFLIDRNIFEDDTNLIYTCLLYTS